MNNDQEEILRRAAARRPTLVHEIVWFLARTGKWWFVPLITALLLASFLALLGAGGAAPFIYTLF